MTRPLTPFVRRRELMLWLNAEGFSCYQIKEWIARGTIPRRQLGGVRAHYCVADVAAALQLHGQPPGNQR